MAAQKQPRALHSVPAHPLQLADNLVLDVDQIVSEGILICGIKGSGKSSLGRLLAEQISEYRVPLAIFDIEGADYTGLVDRLPRGYLATSTNCPTGRDILDHGLQCVYDLSTWSSHEQAASAMMSVVHSLMYYAGQAPVKDRVPCLLYLDEAAYWLPQGQASHLEKETFAALRDTWRDLARRGRKRGLIPCLLTQRISELHKEVMAQCGVFFLLRAAAHTDLAMYMHYLVPPVNSDGVQYSERQFKELIRRLQPGQGYVRLANGRQVRAQFHAPISESQSHTPKVSAALERFSSPMNREALDFGALTPVAVPTPAAIPASGPASAAQPRPRVQRPPTMRARIYAALSENPALTIDELAALFGCPYLTAKTYRNHWFQGK